jgi:signal transduction histidine kinase
MVWVTGWLLPMSRRQPLARRIVTAFVLLTVVVSGIFSAAVMMAVQHVESHLAAEELRAELEQITARDSSGDDPPVLGANTRLYASYAPHAPVPPRYAEFEVGFSEQSFDDGDYYAYVLERDGERYVLEQRHSFAARERLMQLLVLAGFGTAVLASWLLGRLVARRVMMPVARLSRQVRNRDQLLVCAPALAPEYARDEVGDLAVAFDDALVKLQHALERERLFTADVSHELRTPLMVIASSCELLAESELSPSQRARLERISRAVDDMQAQVSALLLLARAEAGRKVLLGEDALLSHVAADQCRQWAGPDARKGAALRVHRAGAVRIAWAAGVTRHCDRKPAAKCLALH